MKFAQIISALLIATQCEALRLRESHGHADLDNAEPVGLDRRGDFALDDAHRNPTTVDLTLDENNADQQAQQPEKQRSSHNDKNWHVATDEIEKEVRHLVSILAELAADRDARLAEVQKGHIRFAETAAERHHNNSQADKGVTIRWAE